MVNHEECRIFPGLIPVLNFTKKSIQHVYEEIPLKKKQISFQFLLPQPLLLTEPTKIQPCKSSTRLAWGSMGAEAEDVIPLGTGNDGITKVGAEGLKAEGAGDEV